MKLRSVCALVAAMSFGSALAANTWYVDDDNYGKEGLDGVTPETAYGTIQDAIDAATTKAGDTILVLPGVYDKGVADPKVVSKTFYTKTRVLISKTNLTIKSTDGADVTHIVGYKDPEAPEKYHGAWSNAVACIVVPWMEKPKAVIEGFTIRDGACCSPADIDSNSCHNNGGAFAWYIAEKKDQASNFHLIACAISNCVGRLGICNSCTLHRCLVTRNIAISNTGGTSGSGAGLGYGRAENTLFIENIGNDSVFASSLVNCLVTGTRGDNYGVERVDAYNSIYAGNYIDWDEAYKNAATCFTNSVSTGRGSGNAPERYGTSSNSVFSAAYTNLFFASALRDFRLIADSCAVGRGDPKFLSAVTPLPEGYAYKDFYGREIDLEAETVNAGISQETVSPRSGCATFALGSGNTCDMVNVNGVPLCTPYGCCVWSTNALEQLCVTGAKTDTNPLSCVADDSGDGIYHFVTRDGRVLVTLPRAGATKTLTAECAMKIFYIDPTHGDDAFDGSCAWEDADVEARKGPWRTLLYAGTNVITKSSQRYLVRCASGNYAEGETGDTYHARVRVLSGRKLHFDATAGVSETAIVGAPDPDPESGKDIALPGCGANAIRGVLNNATGTGFTGFTFTNCYTTSSNDWPYYQGACVYAGEGRITLGDCVLTGSSGREGLTGGGTDNIYLSRCLITGNKGRVGMHCGGRTTMCGCIYKDNFVTSAGTRWFYAAKNLINCTIYVSPSFTSGKMLADCGECLIYNCIFVNGVNFDKVGSCRGSVLEDCTGTMATGFSNDCVRAEAFLARPSENDFRPGADSAAWRSPVEDFDLLTTHLGTDYFGQPIIADGKVVAAGAVMAGAPNCVCVENGVKLLAVTGLPAGASQIRPGETVTIAPAAAAKRPLALVVNGVTNLFSASGYSYADVVAAGGLLSVRSVERSVWYVNPNTDPAKGVVGGDANHGYSPEFPKLTLTAGVANAISNDTVIAAPGRYDRGSKTYGLPCRVIVPDDVLLLSEAGPEKTFIVGTNATKNVDEDGCGSDATRCVHLGKRARVSGFTLTGGRSLANNTSGGGSADGAAVSGEWNWAVADYPTASDCIISNNVGSFCVVCWVNLENCRILENKGNRGCVVRDTYRVRDVLFARNTFTNAQLFSMYRGTFENITVADDNRSTTGARSASNWGTNADLFLRNCLFLSRDYVGNGSVPVPNCLFANESASWLPRVDPAKVHLDADYRPIIDADNVVLDAGDNGIRSDAADLVSAKDAAGRPRVSNGTIDIGALEADWNPVFSRRLGSRVAVAEASSSCVTNGAGGVSLGADGTLALVWALGGFDGEVHVDVTGTGVLTVSRNGEVEATFTAASDPKVYAIHPEDAADQRLAFAYVPGEPGDGTAAILRCRRRIGMMMIVR